MRTHLLILTLSFALIFEQKLVGQNKTITAETVNATSIAQSTFNKTPEQDPFNKRVRLVQLRLIAQGYISASIDSICLDSNKQQCSLFVGKKYSWDKLNTDNVEEGVLSSIGFRSRNYRQTPFNPKQISKLLERLLAYYENNGFPFVSVWLSEPKLIKGKIVASIELDKGPYRAIDNLIIDGNVKVPRRYIEQQIGIKKGQPYNEERFASIQDRLNEVPFIRSTAAPVAIFGEETTTITIGVERSRANQFNGVLGIQPDEETGDVVLTGDVQLALKNALSLGESFALQWRRPLENTQNLDISLSIPFLFNSPLGIDGALSIYQRDSTFNTVSLEAGVFANLNRFTAIRGFVEQRNSSSLQDSLNNLSELFPLTASTSYFAYGIGVKTKKLDYQPNPRSGYSLTFSGRLGEKQIQAKDDGSIPDSIPQNITQIDLRLNASCYIPVFSQATIKLQFQGGHLGSDLLFNNELYRIGGLKTIRGFDEEEIFASTYGITTSEIRYLFEKNSFFALFMDYAIYERSSFTDTIDDTPLGFGGGLSFDTKAGIFSLYYALGKQFNNPINFSSGKIHFGFVSLF